jgi:hypothetical protein
VGLGTGSQQQRAKARLERLDECGVLGRGCVEHPDRDAVCEGKDGVGDPTGIGFWAQRTRGLRLHEVRCDRVVNDAVEEAS